MAVSRLMNIQVLCLLRVLAASHQSFRPNESIGVKFYRVAVAGVQHY
jgi:hypothetical protein